TATLQRHSHASAAQPRFSGTATLQRHSHASAAQPRFSGTATLQRHIARSFILVLLTVLSVGLSATCSAQVNVDSLLAQISDTTYEAQTLVVWFRHGTLNESFLGCLEQGEEVYDYPFEEGLPLSSEFIMNYSLVSALQNLGVYRIDKLMPYLDPCKDSISISVRGDTVYVPDFSDILVMRYGSDYPVPLVCYSLITMFPDAVKYAEPNFFFRLMSAESDSLRKSVISTPSDPEFGSQRQLKLFTDSLGRVIGGVNAITAWDFVAGDSTIRIGMIDDGIIDTLPDFKDTTKTVVIDGYYYLGKDAANAGNWNLRVRHGNYTASIIGSLSNDTVGIAGVAGGWNDRNFCKLIALKVDDGMIQGGGVSLASVAPAIIGGSSRFGTDPYLPQYQKVAFACELLNMSMRADPTFVQSEVIRAALAYAYTNDVVLLTAIGNEGQSHDTMLTYPPDADDRFVVCVSGSGNDGRLHPQSDFGSSVDFAAPFSVWAYAATWGATKATYNLLPGTSGSTPLVTGGFALLRAYQRLRYNGAMAGDPQFLPLNVPYYLAPEDYQNIFALSAHNMYDRPPLYQPVRNANTGYGVVDIGDALTYLQPPFSLEHLDLTGELTIDQLPSDTLYMAMPHYYTDPGPGLDNLQNDDLYEVIPYRVHGTITYPRRYSGTIRAWARGAKSVGLEYPRHWAPPGQTHSKRFPLYLNANWANVLDWTDANVNVETYIYKRRKYGTQDPFEYIQGYGPADVKFAISLIHGAPVAVNPLPDLGFNLSGSWPSPVSGVANLLLTLKSQASVTAELYDIYGRQIRHFVQSSQMTPGAHVLTIPAGNLPAGVYLVRVAVDGVPETRKFVVFR
ncbi:MAG: S8 family peptidase, partial [Bacteroidetes bacterium]|nr:S8 family peptidase [Bacteroidota bacterium]